MACALACAQARQLLAQDLADPVKISVELRDIDGKTLEKVEPNAAFTLLINATDVLTGKPAALGEMTGWLRPVIPGQPDCRSAGRMARASGTLPRGDISLNGRWFVSIDSENRLTVLDQQENGSKVRQIALKDLRDRPAAVRVDSRRQEVLVALPKRKQAAVLRIPDLQVMTLLQEAVDPVDILRASTDGWWIADRGQNSLLKTDAGGKVTQRVPMTSPAWALLRLSGSRLAVLHEKGLTLLDERAKDFAPKFFMTSSEGDVAFSEQANALLWHDRQSKSIDVRYLDDIGNSQKMPTALLDATLSVVPPGRYVFAASKADDAIEVFDLASGVRQWKGHFGQPVEEVAYGGGFAFLALADRSTVIAIELGSLAAKTGVRWREIRTGVAVEPQGNDQSPFPMLAAAPENPSAYLVKSEKSRGTAFRIMAGETALSAPMSSVEFKSGGPIGMWVVERGLRSVSPGRLLATAQVPDGGDFELVVTDGPLGFTSCHLIPGSSTDVARGAADEIMLDIALPSKPFKAGTPSLVNIVAVYRKSRKRLQLPGDVQVTAFELAGPWRSTAKAVLLPDGTLQAEFRFPRQGRYPLIIESGGAALPVPAIASVVK